MQGTREGLAGRGATVKAAARMRPGDGGAGGGRGAVDEKKLIRREVVTRIYKILDPFDLLAPTTIKP